jgi:hypothetical protein
LGIGVTSTETLQDPGLKEGIHRRILMAVKENNGASA